MKNKFCINQLMQSFLYSHRSQSSASVPTPVNLSAANLSNAPIKNSQFIIVESNFKVYAYTDSLLYRAILCLFMREDYRFQNLIVGMLTRDSLKEAFKKKITTS